MAPSTPECRDWQAQGPEIPGHPKERAGSIPTLGTQNHGPGLSALDRVHVRNDVTPGEHARGLVCDQLYRDVLWDTLPNKVMDRRPQAR
jgi:hypothetical protein